MVAHHEDLRVELHLPGYEVPLSPPGYKLKIRPELSSDRRNRTRERWVNSKEDRHKYTHPRTYPSDREKQGQ